MSEPKINIGIMGGAFDPPTLGHIQVAQYALDHTDLGLDEVWLIPCFKSIWNKQMASPEHRLAMCLLASKNDKRIKVSDYEISHKSVGRSYDILKKMMEEPFSQDGYNLSFIIGMDNANVFDKWYNSEMLQQLVRFIVFPRTGIVRDEKVTWYLKWPHVLVDSSGSPIMEVSSTEIREKIHNRKDVSNLVDSEVLEYIKKNGLYLEK